MIKTRFSPSPTGMIHLGNARAALFSALYAKHMKGAFLLRIEDTDQSRSDEKYTDILQDDIRWLGAQWDEGPYWQSKRHEIYLSYYQKLEETGNAYPCFCSDQELALNRKLQLSRGHAPRYPGTCRGLSPEEVTKRIVEGKQPTLRFRVPVNQMIEFIDLVKGQQRFNSDDIGDFIIRRADKTSSFLFCNAIDDSLMGVTHVIRGEDHLANTPRQLMILQALDMPTPHYGHLSLIMGEDGGKLSKRHGSASLHDLRTEGYLPLAVINYLSRLSHVYDEQRLMSFNELATHFRLEKISRSPARFDTNQLLHWQKEAVLALNKEEAWHWLEKSSEHIILEDTTPEKKLLSYLALHETNDRKIKDRIPTDKQDLFIDMMRKNVLFPSEAKKWTQILFGKELELNQEKISILAEAGENFFNAAQNAVEKHQTDLKSILDELKQQLGISGKRLFMPLRIALTGEEHGPELINIVDLLGAAEMKNRFAVALQKIKR